MYNRLLFVRSKSISLSVRSALDGTVIAGLRVTVSAHFDASLLKLRQGRDFSCPKMFPLKESSVVWQLFETSVLTYSITVCEITLTLSDAALITDLTYTVRAAIIYKQ